jgi:hypothetical protein
MLPIYRIRNPFLMPSNIFCDDRPVCSSAALFPSLFASEQRLSWDEKSLTKKSHRSLKYERDSDGGENGQSETLDNALLIYLGLDHVNL